MIQDNITVHIQYNTVLYYSILARPVNFIIIIFI